MRLPEGYRRAFAAFVERGWPGLTAPEAYGGQGLGGIVGAVVSEIQTGASQAFNMRVNLTPGSIRTLMAFARFVAAQPQTPGLARAMAAWGRARAHLEAGAAPGPVATPFLRLAGRVLEQAVWARIATVAGHHPEPARLARIAALVAWQSARAEADLAEILEA